MPIEPRKTQPREVSWSVRELLRALYTPEMRDDSLATIRNLLLLGDEIITLRHEACEDADAVCIADNLTVSYMRERDQLRAEVERLQAEVGQLRKDAARLDWLEAEGHGNISAKGSVPVQYRVFGAKLMAAGVGSSLREAIDQASLLSQPTQEKSSGTQDT